MGYAFMRVGECDTCRQWTRTRHTGRRWSCDTCWPTPDPPPGVEPAEQVGVTTEDDGDWE